MADVHIRIDHDDSVTVTTAPAPQWLWRVGPVLTKESSIMPLEIELTREQKVRVHVHPVTAGGQPAALDGPVEFSTDGDCAVQRIDDTSCWLVAPDDSIGDSVLTVRADADLGAGVVPLMDSATIHVTDPMASSLGMGADAPVLKP